MDPQIRPIGKKRKMGHTCPRKQPNGADKVGRKREKSKTNNIGSGWAGIRKTDCRCDHPVCKRVEFRTIATHLVYMFHTSLETKVLTPTPFLAPRNRIGVATETPPAFSRLLGVLSVKPNSFVIMYIYLGLVTNLKKPFVLISLPNKRIRWFSDRLSPPTQLFGKSPPPILHCSILPLYECD